MKTFKRELRGREWIHALAQSVCQRRPDLIHSYVSERLVDGTVSAVRCQPGAKDFLETTVDFIAPHGEDTMAYPFDEWTEGSMTPDPELVAQGCASLLVTEIQELVDTTPF